MSSYRAVQATTQPVPEPIDDCDDLTDQGAVRRIARLRVPVTLGARPWATLFELPDGRRLWCLRLWADGGPRNRCVSPAVLRAYAQRSGLALLEAELRDAEGDDAAERSGVRAPSG